MSRPWGTLGRNSPTWKALRQRVLQEETVCWICGQLVDKRLPKSDPRSATVDHLQKLRDHPELAEVRENLRLAHRDCNSRRNKEEWDHTPGLPTSRDW